MRKIDRLLGILLFLQARRQATAAQLADHFEVSRRTILRDMEALCAEGIPLEAEGGPGGGYRLMPGYFLPPLLFQPDEAWAVLTGVRSWLNHGGVPRRAALVSAANKLAAVLDARTRTTVERMAHRVGQHIFAVESGPWLDDLAEAVFAGRSLLLQYDGADGVSDREVDPYLLYSQGGFWFLQGFCHLRRAIRIFRVDRIRSLRSSGRRFTPPPDMDVSQPYAYRRAAADRPPNVRLTCTPEATRRIADDPEWRSYIQQDGRVAFWVPPDRLSYIAHQLLRFCPGIRVEAPEELREMLVTIAAAISGANAEYPR